MLLTGGSWIPLLVEVSDLALNPLFCKEFCI